MSQTQPQPTSPEAPWKLGLQGARANLVPGIALWIFAMAVLFCYYFLPSTRPAFDALSAFRTEYGFAFSAVSMALFAGLIPFLFLKFRRATSADYPWMHGWFFLVYWGVRGMDIDLWYRVLNRLVGTGNSLDVLAIKTFSDQFGYTALYAMPLTVIAYAWRAEGFSFSRLRPRLRSGFYRREVLPVMIANWGIWIPGLFAVYAMPTALQIPMVNIGLCFYTLMLSHMLVLQAERRQRGQT